MTMKIATRHRPRWRCCSAVPAGNSASPDRHRPSRRTSRAATSDVGHALRTRGSRIPSPGVNKKRRRRRQAASTSDKQRLRLSSARARSRSTRNGPAATRSQRSWAGAPRIPRPLTGFLAQDKIPDISGSYAAALTDPEGTSGKAKPAPYNFFYGPSYSDALRAELTWAAEDWKAKGKPGKPKFVHMGANHPYPNAPKAGRRSARHRTRLRRAAAAGGFALRAGRLQRAMPQPEERRRQLRFIWAILPPPTSR